EFQQAQENGWRERLCVFEEMERPQPSDGAKRNFETARPIDAKLRRVRVHPSVGVRDERLGVSFIARVPVSAPQRYEVLMAAQLCARCLRRVERGEEARAGARAKVCEQVGG